MATEIRISCTSIDRAKRIAAAVSEMMADEGFDFRAMKALPQSGQIKLTFRDPGETKEE